MSQPAVFFDRDNTLIINEGYLGDPAGVVLMPGSATAIAMARRLGFAIITVSNQSGVARGLFDETAVRAVNHQMDKLLLREDLAAIIDLHVYCPFHPEGRIAGYRRESDLRKPSPGMILQAAKQLHLDLKKSWLIGDAIRDIEAGRAAGCRTILFKPRGVTKTPESKEHARVAADFETECLVEAIKLIQKINSV